MSIIRLHYCREWVLSYSLENTDLVVYRKIDRMIVSDYRPFWLGAYIGWELLDISIRIRFPLSYIFVYNFLSGGPVHHSSPLDCKN